MDSRNRGRERRSISWLVLAALLLAGLVVPGVMPGASAQAPEERVIGGMLAGEHAVPFLAAIFVPQVSETGVWCIGALIAPDKVLTAARCVYSGNLELIPPDFWAVALNPGNADLSGQERHSVSAVDVAPGFDPYTCFYVGSINDYLLCHDDAAVLTLTRPVRGVEPVSLVKAGDGSLTRTGRRLTIAGWGGKSMNYPQRDNAYRATIPVFDPGKCARIWESLNGSGDGPLRFSRSQHFCTYKVGVSACYQEMGSPAISESRGRQTLVGVFSSTMLCATAKWPGVYTRLSNPELNDWIRKTAGMPRLAGTEVGP
jgi:secreted trypsin-like serine protease